MSRDTKALDELKNVVGRLATPTIVIDGEVLVGFAANRARIEALMRGEGGGQAAAAPPAESDEERHEREAMEQSIADILKRSKRIAVVGLSPNPARASYGVARYLLDQGYEIIPVNPTVNQVLGLKSYPDLASVPGDIDVVDIFRSAEHIPPIVEAAIARGIPVVWMPEGVTNEEAAQRARAAGLTVVMDRCMMQEHLRLRQEDKL